MSALTLSSIFVNFLGIYFLIGAIAAVPLVFWGITLIDSRAQKVSIFFRLILLPGTLALWPVLIYQWITRGKNLPKDES